LFERVRDGNERDLFLYLTLVTTVVF
jgi:hypothetical protein